MPNESLPRPSRVNTQASNFGAFCPIQEYRCAVCGNVAELVEDSNLVRINDFTPPYPEINLFLRCNNPNCSQCGVNYRYPIVIIGRYTNPSIIRINPNV